MEDSPTKFGAIQYYSKYMKDYFNPFMVVAATLAKMDFNPYIVRKLNVSFYQEDRDDMNAVRITIELNFPMSEDWIENTKHHLSHLMQEAFLTAYGKNTEPWFSNTDKECPPFLKGTVYDTTKS